MSDYKELEEKIKKLEKAIKVYEDRDINQALERFELAYSRIRDAVVNARSFDKDINNTREKLGITDLMNDLLLVNNPYGDKIGFNFITVVEDKVETILLAGLPKSDDPNHKTNRFKRIISKIINNPMADAILNSNPITGVISNVVNAASTFVETKLEKAKSNDAIKNIILTTKDEINDEKLKNFRESLKKYSDFYGDMLRETKKFDLKLEIVIASFNNFYTSFESYYEDFLSTLKSEGNLLDYIDDLFELKDKAPKDFAKIDAILKKGEIVNGSGYADQLPDLIKKLESYNGEFAKIFHEFISEYIKILSKPLNDEWSTVEIDKSKLAKQIKTLSNYLSKNIKIDTSNSISSRNVPIFSKDLTAYTV